MTDVIENNSGIPSGNTSNDGIQYVVLPCEPKHFRNFVAGLLGQPQVANGYVEGIFHIGVNEVANIYYLITQRVSKQNESSLIHIAISVHYSDGNSVTHNNIESFKNFHQTTDSYPIAISLSFGYLIKFIGREIPEKQEIGILISTDTDFRHDDRPDIWFQSGLFSYRITHTEITWATDISGLLKSHANSIVDKSSKFKRFFAARSDEIIGYWFSLIIIGVLALIGASALEMHDNNSISSIRDAARYLTITFCIIVGLIVTLNNIERFINFNVNIRYPSFIVLTERDKQHVNKIKTKQARQWLFQGLGWAFGIATGVLSNHIYVLLTKSTGG